MNTFIFCVVSLAYYDVNKSFYNDYELGYRKLKHLFSSFQFALTYCNSK